MAFDPDKYLTTFDPNAYLNSPVDTQLQIADPNDIGSQLDPAAAYDRAGEIWDMSMNEQIPLAAVEENYEALKGSENPVATLDMLEAARKVMDPNYEPASRPPNPNEVFGSFVIGGTNKKAPRLLRWMAGGEDKPKLL